MKWCGLFESELGLVLELPNAWATGVQANVYCILWDRHYKSFLVSIIMVWQSGSSGRVPA
jgi:hypothetical protein